MKRSALNVRAASWAKAATHKDYLG